MAAFNISRVTELPETLEASTLYLVANGADVEFVTTGATSDIVRASITRSDVTSMIAAATVPGDSMRIVADIAARDALALTVNAFVLVKDATDDATVATGAALYAWDATEEEWIKLSEWESMDVTLDWADIENGPVATASAIDLAVTRSHVHANLTVLDALSEDDGELLFDGNPVGNVTFAASEW